jgi:cyanophycin synthetase
LVRRAAKARGLSTQKVEKTVYIYAGRYPVGGVEKMKNGLNSNQAIVICRSKDLSKKMFRAAGLPTPVGIALRPDQFGQALERVESTDRSSVLKPMSEARGEGVTVGIATEDDLRAAWEAAEQAARGAPAFLLEEQIDGIDVRVHVVGRRAVAAVTRLPAHVVGDGRRAITDLVEVKQQQRDRHAYMAESPITVNSTLLARAGWAVHDVPDDGVVVHLHGPSNVGAGGEAVDVTDLVHPDLLSLAIDASRAIPGLRNTGVDLMAPDLDTVDGAVILETNHWPDIRVHHYPAYGRPRDVAGAIVDEMLAASGLPARKPPRAGAARRVARAARRHLRT